MGKNLVGAAMLGAIGLVLCLVVIVAVAAGSGTGSGSGADASSVGASGTDGRSPGSPGVQPGPAIPPPWVTLYHQAAASCPGLSWSVAAAIGTVETGSGSSTAPGVWSGGNSAGAEGPMQFEPSNFCLGIHD